MGQGRGAAQHPDLGGHRGLVKPRLRHRRGHIFFQAAARKSRPAGRRRRGAGQSRHACVCVCVCVFLSIDGEVDRECLVGGRSGVRAEGTLRAYCPPHGVRPPDHAEERCSTTMTVMRHKLHGRLNGSSRFEAARLQGKRERGGGGRER